LSGHFPAAATDPPMPLEPELAGMALSAAAHRRAPKMIPLQPSESNLAAGARAYRENCAECHGLPGRKATPVAAGLSPQPPRLLEKGGMVNNDPPAETYWKAANGIRLTGMPAFQGSLSSEELWQVSLFLANADKLPPAARQALSAP
ncbi:MAG TPA: cytochrome c, partial [Terriglobia bacterium]|nr:cytochrome c [Terriglobia bacterium]